MSEAAWMNFVSRAARIGFVLASALSAPALRAQESYFHPNDSWIWNFSGYGNGSAALFFGNNPTDAEIRAAINEYAAAYDVPPEIIAAVGYQESALFQFGADHFVVHNRCEDQSAFFGFPLPSCSIQTSPGLGMFQLTGVTASLLNQNRLISDWKYNLKAGVIILREKYDACVANAPASLKTALNLNRAVIENWRYPLEYYNHGSLTPSSLYSDQVLAHLANPPGRLASMTSAVDVTSPVQVIPNYTWGSWFAALSDGSWQTADGTVVAGPIHLSALAPLLIPDLNVPVINPFLKFQVAVDSSSAGTISRQPDATLVASGTIVTLTARPNDQNIFNRWVTSSGATFSEDNPLNFEVTDNIRLRAVFDPKTPRLNVTIANGIAKLTWPSWANSFRLEIADPAQYPLVWQAAAANTSSDGQRLAASVALGLHPAVFRLISQ